MVCPGTHLSIATSLSSSLRNLARTGESGMNILAMSVLDVNAYSNGKSYRTTAENDTVMRPKNKKIIFLH